MLQTVVHPDTRPVDRFQCSVVAAGQYRALCPIPSMFGVCASTKCVQEYPCLPGQTVLTAKQRQKGEHVHRDDPWAKIHAVLHVNFPCFHRSCIYPSWTAVHTICR